MKKEEYLAKAQQWRNDSVYPYNCAQSILLTFADDIGLSREQAISLGANFGGGMKAGNTCGGISAGLMVLGLLGIQDPQATATYWHAFMANHEGMTNCRDLLRTNAERGGQKKPHCDRIVYEAVEEICTIREEKGI